MQDGNHRSQEHSQTRLVQSQCFSLNITTDKLGASFHPSQSELGSRDLQPWGSLSVKDGNAVVLCVSQLSWSPSSAALNPILTCSFPQGIICPWPSQQSTVVSPIWVWGGVSWPSQQNLCLLNPQSNAGREAACLALGLLPPWRNQLHH